MSTHSTSHPSSQSDNSAASASVADYYEKPVMSLGALRAAIVGLLAVACVIGSLLLYWLHTPAAPTRTAAGQPVQSAQSVQTAAR